MRLTRTMGSAWLLCAFAAAPVFGEECPVAPAKGGACWTTEDVIDGRIDHHAQSALFRMFARGGLDALEASAILCAVKHGELEGVYLPDQGVPAKRVRSQGGNWWEMIPPGRHAVCYTPPPERAPLIAFRQQISQDPGLVAAALSRAWRECRIAETDPRCYVATIHKPQVECTTDQDCVEKGLGNACFGQVCGSVDPGDEPPLIPCETRPGECDPDISQEVWRSCPSGECQRVPGQTCGVCREPNDRFAKCLEQRKAEYDEAIGQCRRDELPGAAKCVGVIAKCMVRPDPEGCLEAVGCGVGTPHFKRVQCELEANRRLHQGQRECLEG